MIGVIGPNVAPHVVEDNNQEQELVQILNRLLVVTIAMEILMRHKAVMKTNVLVRLSFM